MNVKFSLILGAARGGEDGVLQQGGCLRAAMSKHSHLHLLPVRHASLLHLALDVARCKSSTVRIFTASPLSFGSSGDVVAQTVTHQICQQRHCHVMFLS